MLQQVEAAYNGMLNQQAGWTDSPYSEFLPFISEQAREWEAAATADTSSTPSFQVKRTILPCLLYPPHGH